MTLDEIMEAVWRFGQAAAANRSAVFSIHAEWKAVRAAIVAYADARVKEERERLTEACANPLLEYGNGPCGHALVDHDEDGQCTVSIEVEMGRATCPCRNVIRARGGEGQR